MNARPRSDRPAASEQALVAPDDAHNRTLVDNVHPRGWTNPAPSGRYNLVVLGAGTAGLVSAIGAAMLGAKVAIVEKHLTGGDCLNFGCVPSKSLLRAARAIGALRDAGDFGLRVSSAEVNFSAAMERLRRVRAEISHKDSAHHLRELGVDVFLGPARFVASDAVEVNGQRLRFSRAVVATGARAAALPVPGLAEAGFLTNETVFSLTELPRRLVVVGAGPIGCELAQAFRRFGSEVRIVSLDSRLLPREDEDVGALLAARFRREGIEMQLGVKILRVEARAGGKAVVVARDGGEQTVVGDEVLVAAGRAPNVEGLDLEAAEVAFDQKGVKVDDRLRTSNRRIYAAGDICSPFKFTHAADAMARIAIQNALFFGRKSAANLVIPWCTYTEPEIAHVGIGAAEASAAGARTFSVPMAEMDRPVIDGESDGFARVHCDRRGKILGATIVSSHAGDMIGELALAMTAALPVQALARTIHPYPTSAEVLKRLGDEALRSRLTPRLRGVLQRFLRWRR